MQLFYEPDLNLDEFEIRTKHIIEDEKLRNKRKSYKKGSKILKKGKRILTLEFK